VSATAETFDPDATSVSEEDALRANVYDMLAAVFRREPESALLSELTRLQGDDTPLGQAFAGLATRARATKLAVARREYSDLFIGLGRGELVPYGSFYLTGFLNEKPLAVLRDDMARLGIVRTEGVSEPEDHIAALCEMMAGLIRGRFIEAAPVKLQRAFFERHLAPWVGHFFADVEAAKSADLYRPAGTIGRLFMEIETAAFAMEE
jgi:TorA maturation chaperone TorD